MECCPTLFSTAPSRPNHVVAPFWADVDARSQGKISYQVFTMANNDSLKNVSRFVSSQMGVSFMATWMLVAEWYQVTAYRGENYTVSDLQCFNEHSKIEFVWYCFLSEHPFWLFSSSPPRQTHSKEL